MPFDIGKLKSLLQLKPSEKKDDQVIGIDIGSSAIKVAGLHISDGVPTLDTYGELQLGPYANESVGKTVHVPEMKLREALVDIMRESSLTGTHAAFSVAHRSSFMTTLTLDTISEQEIESRIPIEARKYVPIPLAEVTLDWFVLSTDTKNKTTKILLAAIFNEAFDESQHVLEGAGLSLGVSELEPFGAVRATISTEDKSVALIDFGAASTKLYIVQGGMVQDVHVFRLSGVELTQIVADTLTIDFAAAEEIKRSAGITGNGEHAAIAVPLKKRIERGLREIGNRITAEEAESGTAITKVYALGGGSFLPALIPFAQEVLQRPVAFVDPFSKVAYPAFLEDTLARSGPSFCVAIGVALRGLTDR